MSDSFDEVKNSEDYEKHLLNMFRIYYEAESDAGREIVDRNIALITKNMKARNPSNPFGESHAKQLYFAFVEFVNLSEGTRAHFRRLATVNQRGAK